MPFMITKVKRFDSKKWIIIIKYDSASTRQLKIQRYNLKYQIHFCPRHAPGSFFPTKPLVEKNRFLTKPLVGKTRFPTKPLVGKLGFLLEV